MVLLMSLPLYAQQVLNVGINATGAPFSFQDANTGVAQGIAVELIAEIGRDAGFQPRFIAMTLGELIPALNGNKIAIIAGNLLITRERAALVDFSDAIVAGGDGLVVPATDMTPYRTLDDLRGLTIGSQAGSPFAEAMRKSDLFPDLKIYPNGTLAMHAVDVGEIKAAVVGVNGAAYEIKLGHFPNLQLVKTYQPLVASVDAFSVRKGDTDLLQRINVSLAKLRSNGTLDQVLRKYGQGAP